jgi:hypothetical protein
MGRLKIEKNIERVLLQQPKNEKILFFSIFKQPNRKYP